MSFLKLSASQSSVYICKFQCFINQVNVEMKFPCSYFIQWRTINSKSIAKTQMYQPQKNIVVFQEKIRLSLQMIFDNARQQFLKRQTIVELFLVSKSRPDQTKIVGRANIDLSKVINCDMYSEPTIFQLSFSSVQSSLIMQFQTIERNITSISIHNLDKSSFAEYIARNDFKSLNKYESIVLSKYQNKGHQKNSLEKTSISDAKMSVKYENSKQRYQQKGQILNDSMLYSKDIENGGQQKRSNFKLQSISKTNNQDIQEINQTFSKVNNQHELKSQHWTIRQQEEKLRLTKQLSQLKEILICKDNEIDIKKKQSITFNLENGRLRQTLNQKDKQMATMKDNLTQLQHQVQRLKSEVRQLKNINLKHSRLNEQISSQMRMLTQQIINSKDIITNQANQLKEVSSYNNQLKKEANELSKLNCQLKQKYSQMKSQDFQMLKLRDQLKCQMIKNQKMQHYKNRGDSLQLQNMLLAQRLKQQEKNAHQYELKFTNLEQLVIKLEQANEKCNERVRQSEEIQLQLRSQLQQLEIQNNHMATSLQNQRQELNIQNQKLQKQLQLLQSQLLTSQQSNNNLKTENQKTKDIMEKYVTLQKDRFQLLKKCEQYDEAISNLHGNIQHEIDKNHQLTQTIIQYRQKEAILKNNLNFLEQQSKQIMQSYREKESNQIKLMQIIEQLQNKLNLISKIYQAPEYKDQQEIASYNIKQREQLLKKRQQIIQNQSTLIKSASQAELHHIELKNHISNLIIKRKQSKQKLHNFIRQLTEQINNDQNNQHTSEKKKEIDDSPSVIKDYKDKQIDCKDSKASSKQKQYDQFERQLQQLKKYIQQIQDQKCYLQSLVKRQEKVIEELEQSNDQLLQNAKQRQASFNPTVMFRVLDELRHKLQINISNQEWNVIIQEILNKRVIKQVAQILLQLDEKIKLMLNHFQKLKFSINKLECKNASLESTNELIQTCQQTALDLITLSSLLNENVY